MPGPAGFSPSEAAIEGFAALGWDHFAASYPPYQVKTGRSNQQASAVAAVHISLFAVQLGFGTVAVTFSCTSYGFSTHHCVYISLEGIDEQHKFAMQNPSADRSACAAVTRGHLPCCIWPPGYWRSVGCSLAASAKQSRTGHPSDAAHDSLPGFAAQEDPISLLGAQVGAVS